MYLLTDVMSYSRKKITQLLLLLLFFYLLVPLIPRLLLPLPFIKLLLLLAIHWPELSRRYRSVFLASRS